TGAFPVARYTYNFLSTDINNFLALISFLKDIYISAYLGAI
ncbi:unnamed protein product, partial [Penicillium nalgiovense]